MVSLRRAVVYFRRRPLFEKLTFWCRLHLLCHRLKVSIRPLAMLITLQEAVHSEMNLPGEQYDKQTGAP
ncbi:MAG: hypothetical protein PVG47_10230, partial [Chromatiales bacterium]